MGMTRFLLLVVLLAAPYPLWAQVGLDTATVHLQTVEIEATRSALAQRETPLSLGLLSLDMESRTGVSRSLTEAMAAMPGVMVSDRENLSQGERLSIRGMGWRSAFGVRGVHVLLDGIPLTLPDGQTTMDILEPAYVTRAEVIRGPASSLWGNAGGGVLYLATASDPSASSAEVGLTAGSYGLRRSDVRFSLAHPSIGLTGFISHATSDGYRAYSRAVRTRAGLRADTRLSAAWRLNLVGALVIAPTAENPGALTRTEWETDPRQADSRYPVTKADKDATQGQAGIGLTGLVGGGVLSVTAYGLARRLENPLPFAYIRLHRRVGGGRVNWFRRVSFVRLTAGADAGFQRDHRFNWNNNGGEPGEELSLDQVETVQNLAVFGQAHFDLGRVFLQAGVRGDRLRFAADDRLLDNGDQSGHRIFHAVSPSFGVLVPMRGASVYGNVATSFESPTTTELVNRPDVALGGFNPDLDPQRTRGAEVGMRGLAPVPDFRMDFAAFMMRVDGLLTPFQTDAGGDRVFYRNQGRTSHSGIELSADWSASGPVDLFAWYTWSRFVFVDGPNEDEDLPGLPVHRFFGEIRWTTGPLVARAQVEAASGMSVDDPGSARTDAYAIGHLYAAWSQISLGKALRMTPHVSVRNLLDARYLGSVVVNARGGRFYEPAAGRNWLVGVRVSV